jgi:hypothetical protein
MAVVAAAMGAGGVAGTHPGRMVTMPSPGRMVMAQGAAERMGMRRMGEVRYAVRVRGRTSDVQLAAALEGLEGLEGLEVAVDPVRTVLRGRLPDQAALLGILARTRLLGLELVEVRRLPQAG